MNRVWLYLVVSSEAQDETLEAQRRWGFQEAARIGATVDPQGIFEGVSTGKHGARAILMDLIARLRSQPKATLPSRVLMTRLDRTGRMPLDAIAALNEIRKLGVTIRDRINGDYTFKRVIDQVGPIFTLLQAGFENEARSDRSRAGYERKRAAGLLLATKPPYGIRRGLDGKAAADGECASIVREVYRRWNCGDSPAGIVAWLRAVAPPRRGKGGDFALRWSLSHLYKMVHLAAYRGVVVSPETWDKAQLRRKPSSRPGRGGRIYPFAGMLCACGDRLHPRTNTAPTRYKKADGSTVLYERKTMAVWYVCQSLKHRSGPRFRSFSESAIEESWLSVLANMGQTHAWTVPSRVRDPGPEIETLRQRIGVISGRRARIHLAFESGDYDADTMRRRLAATDGQERELEAQIAQLRSEHEEQQLRSYSLGRITELLRNAPRTYKRANRRQRKRINVAIFEAVGNPMINDKYEIAFPG